MTEESLAELREMIMSGKTEFYHVWALPGLCALCGKPSPKHSSHGEFWHSFTRPDGLYLGLSICCECHEAAMMAKGVKV